MEISYRFFYSEGDITAVSSAIFLVSIWIDGFANYKHSFSSDHSPSFDMQQCWTVAQSARTGLDGMVRREAGLQTAPDDQPHTARDGACKPRRTREAMLFVIFP